MRKLRAYPGVYKCLSEFKPNTILFHGTCAWALRATARYAYDNPGVPLYVDSHEDSNNSGRSFVSRELLHKRFYGPIIRSSLPWIRKILAISTESIDFVTETYGVPRDKLEFYPLGGRPLPDDEYSLRRRRTRKRLGLTDDQIAITHVGKQHPGKKLVETLDAFSEVDERRLRLFVGGSLQDSIRAVAEQRMAADERVTYLGWQDREGLADLLCAADVYVQPGSQSATMQHSLCCRCAVILNDVPAHRVYQTGNGWFVSSRAELVAALREVVTADLAGMQANSFKIAQEMLDYSVLAERILR
jgi:glycosyltransferase involved in cell wall biosynthesis